MKAMISENPVVRNADKNVGYFLILDRRERREKSLFMSYRLRCEKLCKHTPPLGSQNKFFSEFAASYYNFRLVYLTRAYL